MVDKRDAHKAAQSNDETATPQDQSRWTTAAPSAQSNDDTENTQDQNRRSTADQSAAPGAQSAKTSTAAAFALVFGVIAFISALTGALAPLAIVFGIVGIVVGIIGRKKGTQPQVTGKGVATAGLVLSIIALLVGIALAIGVVTVLVNPGLLDPVQQWFTNLVNQLPGR